MTQLHINVDYEELKAELMESNLGAVSKSYIVIMMNAYMEMERDQYVQTTKYERHMDRQDYRNGYYSRDYVTGLGKIELK
ncbi:transposase, partial [Halalkalibacillus halophilus]